MRVSKWQIFISGWTLPFNIPLVFVPSRSITQNPQQLSVRKGVCWAESRGLKGGQLYRSSLIFSLSFHLKRAEEEEEGQGTLKRIQKLVGVKKGTQSGVEESRNSTDTRGEKTHFLWRLKHAHPKMSRLLFFYSPSRVVWVSVFCGKPIAM